MLCPVAYEARCPKCAPATPTQVPPAPAIAAANATSSADAAIGTTPVKAAEPAAVVAAISPVTTDSVNEDRFTASGETSNIDMFVSRVLIRSAPLRDFQSLRSFLFLRIGELCMAIEMAYSPDSGEPTSTPSISPSVVTNRPRPGGN